MHSPKQTFAMTALEYFVDFKVVDITSNLRHLSRSCTKLEGVQILLRYLLHFDDVRRSLSYHDLIHHEFLFQVSSIMISIKLKYCSFLS